MSVPNRKDQKEATGGLEFELGTIRTWLKRKVALKFVQHLLASLVYAVAGLGISFFTFFFTYAVVWFGFNFGVSAFSQLVFNKELRLSHHQILGVCGIFMALLLIENARKSPDDSDSWTSARPMTTQPLWLAGMFGALVSLLINFNTSGKAITDILFIGPRMLTGSINHALAVRRIRHTDFHGCSFALGLLAKSGHKLSAADFAVAIPGSSPADLFSQLIDVQAAILISKEPAVITLTDSVREELRHLLGDPTEFNFKDAAEPIPPTIFGNPDHYALLGLVPPASLDQIKTAYRTVIKEYHPDKFAGGPPGFRALAEEKTKEINAAYEALVASHSAQRGGPGA